MQGHPDDWMIVADRIQELRKPCKLIGYRLMQSDKTTTTDSLESVILEWVAKGYELYGNPYESKQGFPCQAMVKYEE